MLVFVSYFSYSIHLLIILLFITKKITSNRVTAFILANGSDQPKNYKKLK